MLQRKIYQFALAVTDFTAGSPERVYIGVGSASSFLPPTARSFPSLASRPFLFGRTFHRCRRSVIGINLQTFEEDTMSNAKNPLQRSRRHRIIAGVCGGFADWLGWNPTLVRVLYVVVSILSAAFPGILAYIILWILMPDAD